MIKARTFKEPEIKETTYNEESDIYDIYLIDFKNSEYKVSVQMSSKDENGYFTDVTIEERSE